MDLDLGVRARVRATEFRSCFTFIAMVSLYCDDDDYDCVYTDIVYITGVGYWGIGENPARVQGGWVGVRTLGPAGSLWPHQVRSWQYYWFKGPFVSGEWLEDNTLTVKGKILFEKELTLIECVFCNS